MNKAIIVIVALLVLIQQIARCQFPVLGISQNGGNVVLSVTNAPGETLASLTEVLILQTTPSLEPSTLWTSETNWIEEEIHPGTLEFAANNPEQFYRLLLEIPIFNFAIFYNLNLEMAFAQNFGVAGPVFSNAGLWTGSTSITFSNTVSAVGLATNSISDPFCAGYIGSGLSKYTFAGQPTSKASPLVVFNTNISINPTTAESFLNLPPANYVLGTSAAYKANGQSYFANATDLYLTNFPGGTNWGWNGALPQGAPMALYYQDPANAPNYLTWCTNDFYIVSNYYHGAGYIFQTNYVPTLAGSAYYSSTFGAAHGFWFTNGTSPIKWTNSSSSNGPAGTNYVVYIGYSFLTNVFFYDWREGFHFGAGPPKTVQAIQIDLRAFSRWLTNGTINGGSNFNYLCSLPTHKSHPIDSIYIYNAVPLTSTVLPAVRIVNGGRLPPADDPYGFTLATAMPLYVWGDYNVFNNYGSALSQNNCQYTEPAAIMADAISILSDNWSDANSSPANRSTDTSGGPTAATTTINAACLAGIVPSNPYNSLSEGISDGYSGGVENFLRLLENWNPGSGQQTFYFNGSIAAMFPSQYATNCWQQTGYYYTAPIRSWAFDTNFFYAEFLPPLTPTVANFVNP